MAGARLPLLLLPLMLAVFLGAAYASTCLVYTVNYTTPYYGNESVAIPVPPGPWSVVLSPSGEPLPSSILDLGRFAVAVWRDAPRPAGALMNYSVCDSSVAHPDGFALHEQFLVTLECPGTLNYTSFTATSTGELDYTIVSHEPWLVLLNMTADITVYVYYPPATVDAYLCYDAGCILLASQDVTTTRASFTVSYSGAINATSVRLVVNATGQYLYTYYVLASGEAYYMLPTANSTNITIGPFDVARIVVAGRGWIALGTAVNKSFTGLYVVDVTPYGSSLNGTYTPTVAHNATIGFYCVGVDAEEAALVQVYASNVTSVGYSFAGSTVSGAVQAGTVVNVNISSLSVTVNATQKPILGREDVAALALLGGAAAVVALVYFFYRRW